MKIAVFNRHFSRRAGGAESYSVALVEGLANRMQADGSPEFEVHVFAQVLDHHHPHVTYHKVPGPIERPRWINQWLFATYTWWKTRKGASKGGFDVVHSHENTWHGQVQTVHVRPIRFHLFEGRLGTRALLRWLKIITSPRLAFYIWLEAARMRHKPNRTVVAVSETMRQQTLSAYPNCDPQMPVILPGVGAPNQSLTQTEARTALGLPLGKRLILFVGNDYARKGLPALLAAMPALHGNTYAGYKDVTDQPHLVVVGSRRQIPKFKAMAAAHGIADRVHFLGALADVSQAYRAVDGLVHPTLEDSFAMVVLEAMSYGLPVVVSSKKYCGISAFFNHEEHALILQNPRDSEEITTAIARITMQPSLRQALSSAGLRFAAEHSWDLVVDRYAQIYAAVTRQ